MIRTATEEDFLHDITTVSELRIYALKRAYGLDVPFIQYMADEEGTLASIMDGFCVVFSKNALNEEWVTFLQMQPNIQIIHSAEHIIAALSEQWQIPFKNGELMRYDNVTSENALHINSVQNVSLRELYAFHAEIFEEMAQFDGWYVDVSHRVRHGCCHITTALHEERLIGSAMTVAETETAALIGGVATLPEYREQGVATRCITDLLAALPQTQIYIAPSDEKAASLYRRLGFVPCGTWAELILA